MSGRKSLILGIIVLALGVVAYQSFFAVHQTPQAVVFQFGAIGRFETEPDLKFKFPVVRNVAYL